MFTNFPQKPLKVPLLKTVTGDGLKQAVQANDCIILNSLFIIQDVH